MTQRWPLTGRVEEMRFINRLTRPGSAPGVVVAGEAGVGKTRLAREVAAAATRGGMLTRWVAATESSRGWPLGAFSGLVGDVGRDPARLMLRAVDAVLAIDEAPGGARPAGTLIVVDDAHLLDELSAVLVQRLALDRRATVVLTLRSGEPAPSAVTALWKDSVLPRLELQALSQVDATTLLGAVLGGPVDSGAARRLWTITRGNVLYLRQLVDGELSADRLSEAGGVWRWSGVPELSPSLTDLVDAQMGQLSDAVGAVVEVLAFGEPLGVSLLGGMTDPDAVEQAEKLGVIEVYRDRHRWEARLAHPLFGEVTRAGCPLLRARRVRGQLASTLAQTGARRTDDTLRRAMLTMDSDLPPAPVLLTEAAHRAAELIDPSLAELLARAAIAAGGGFEPALTLATVLVGAGFPAEAELAALSAGARTDAERVRAAVMQVTSLAWMSSRPAQAEAALAAATAAVTDAAASQELAAVRVCLDACLGRPVNAAEAAADLLASDRLTDQAIAFACFGSVVAMGALGRTDEIGPLVERGEAAAGRSADAAWLTVPLLCWHAFTLRLAGYLREAGTAATRCHDRFGEQTAPAISGLVEAAVKLATGQIAASLRLLLASRSALTPLGSAGVWVFACLLELTRAQVLSGDMVAAREALADLETAEHPGFVTLHPETTLAKAWVAAGEGAVSQAVALAHDAARTAAATGQHAHEVLALHTAVCLGDPTPAARLAELVDEVDGPRAPAAAAHAAALAADDGDALHAASVQLEDMGDVLLAADAAAQATAAHTRHDRRGSAQASAARAHRLAEACDGARTPALVAAAAPLPLTDREREILTLASAGTSNKEIAERLVISVRTVEGHRYRACAKLGTSDATEVATLLSGQ